MTKYVGFKIGKVHESHVISEYYCGGCGWPVTDHDSFCPECGGAFRECDASNLEVENAKLRDEFCKMDQWHSAELMAALDENTKLRKQIEALKDYAHALELCKNKAYLCEYCPFNGIDFDHDDINCTIDFDGLRKKAGCEKKNEEIINNG